MCVCVFVCLQEVLLSYGEDCHMRFLGHECQITSIMISPEHQMKVALALVKSQGKRRGTK